MTNKEVLIQALQNFDGEYENNITDYIECPYTSDIECLIEQRDIFDFSSSEGIEACRECKAKWLLKEWEE